MTIKTYTAKFQLWKNVFPSQHNLHIDKNLSGDMFGQSSGCNMLMVLSKFLLFDTKAAKMKPQSVLW